MEPKLTTVYFGCFAVLLTWLGCIDAAGCPGSWTPCLCDHGTVNCAKHNLSSMIQFTSSNQHFHTLDYSYNGLLSVEDNAFAALSNNNFTTLLLQYNQISSISQNAFDGIQGTLLVLNLAHNRLTTLPDIFKILSVITDIDVSGNPITDTTSTHGHHQTTTSGFSNAVMYAIGNTLTRFKLGDAFTLKYWPTALSHLVQLTDLHIDGTSLNIIPSGAFHGFEHTLKTLTIEHARLIQLPLELTKMTVLEELHVDHNYVAPGSFGEDLIQESALIALRETLHTLSFKYDKMAYLPEAIKYLNNLKNLSLEGNPFEFISEEAISFIKNTPVEILSFKNCGLTRIPGSLSDVSNLIEIDLSQNRISSIENNDLFNLPHLLRVSFAENPLLYISRNSFHGLNSVELMDFSKSNMTILSEAIQNLASLKTLDVSDARIDCTCDLYWVKRWLVIYQRTLNIKGQCETINEEVQRYIDERIPHCLQYTNP